MKVVSIWRVVGVLFGLLGIAGCDLKSLPGPAAVSTADAGALAPADALTDPLPPDAAPPPPGIASAPGGLPRSEFLQTRLLKAFRKPHTSEPAKLGADATQALPPFTNRLVLESSPYLLEHAHEPVDWFAWGLEPFERARIHNRPVLLVIGDHGCSRCRQMSETGFQHPDIAERINRDYIAIHVDRRLRPDVARLYQRARFLIAGDTGWPTVVWLTPAGAPFMASGYLGPRDPAHPKQRSFTNVLKLMHSEFVDDHRGVISRAGKTLSSLGPQGDPPPPTRADRKKALTALRNARRYYIADLDRLRRGLGEGAKKLQLSGLEFLLRTQTLAGRSAARDAALKTLDALAVSGLRDHLGGGFHEPGADPAWRVPDFTINLASNARLVSLYVAAHQITRQARYADVALATLAFIDERLSDPKGGFMAGFAAESDQGIGGYYLWRIAALDAAAGPSDSALLRARFGVTPRGNFSGGASVLRLAVSPENLAHSLSRSVVDVRQGLDRGVAQLRAHRAKRPAPWVDTQVIAGWTGLAISAFAQAGRVLSQPKLVRRAERAARYLLQTGDELVRIQAPAHRPQRGFLEDYAYVIAGLIDLFDATQSPEWLRSAIALQDTANAQFGDPLGVYHLTSARHEKLLAMTVPFEDRDLPSASSVTAHNLLRLWAITDNVAYQDKALRLLRALANRIARSPRDAPLLLSALDHALAAPPRIAMVDPVDPVTAETTLEPLLAAFDATHVPGAVWVRARQGEEGTLAPPFAAWAQDCHGSATHATACVCTTRKCRSFTRPALFRKALAHTQSRRPRRW